MRSGALQFTARREDVAALGRRFAFTSGMASTADPDHTLYAFRYGYIETRARVPAGVGFWSAFWLLPESRSALPEVDVFEIVGYQPDVVLEFTHWFAGGDRKFGNAVPLPAVANGWHVYGLDWESSGLTWYVDGRKVWNMSVAAAIPQQPMTIVADLAIGGPLATTPRSTTAFPASMQLDYVKVWQHP